MKTTPERTPQISLGVSIFLTTITVVTAVLLLTGLVLLVLFSGTLVDTAEAQAREINRQITMNYEGYINSVMETANYIQFTSYGLDVRTDSVALSALYRMNAEIKEDVIAIFLFDESGNRMAGPQLDYSAVGTIAGRYWFSLALINRDIYHFIAHNEPSLAANREDPVIAVSRAVEYTRNGRVYNGVLLIELMTSAITDLARRTNLGTHGHLLIVDERGQLLYSSEPAPAPYTQESSEIARDLYLGGRRTRIASTDLYLYANTILHTRWRLVTAHDISGVRIAMTSMVASLVAMFIIAILSSAAAAGYVSLQVSRPATRLRELMQLVESGDFSITADITGQREIAALAHAFNSMIQKIRDLMDSLVAEQRQKRKSELQALQNQINPHFLYNTLDSIVWLAENERPAEVITTVVALARLFRLSISRGHTFIPVRDEIAHIGYYLTIQSIRYVDRFTYSIDVDENLLDLPVMKLVLQPVVENAIQHGLGDERGHIGIHGTTDGDCMVFSVTNTGYGITEATITTMYRRMKDPGEQLSVGMRNVYQRLTLYYGDRADVMITSVQDESTTVSLRIPLDYRPPEEP